MEKNKYIIEQYDSPKVSDSQTSVSIEDDAIAKAKREQNYKAYYDTAIQQYNMKNNTQKYLNNALASRGLETQGYGSSAQIGINNEALNLYAQNRANYEKEEQDITDENYARYENKQNELDNQLVTFIQSAIQSGNVDAIEGYMKNYGYYDDNGNPTEKWNSLDDDRKAYIQSVIDGKSIYDNAVENYVTYNSLDSLLEATYVNNKGNVETLGEHYEEETKLLWHYASTGSYTKGDTIKVTNEKGNTIYLQWTGYGFRTVSEKDFDTAENKYVLERNKKNKTNTYSKV